MTARPPLPRRSHALLAVAVAAAALAPAAARADCNVDMAALASKRTVASAALDANKKAHGGKLDPISACPQLRALAAAQGAVVAYMRKNQDWCSLPDELVKASAGAQSQISGFATKACGMVAKIKEMQTQQAAAAQQQAAQIPQLKLPAGPL